MWSCIDPRARAADPDNPNLRVYRAGTRRLVAARLVDLRHGTEAMRNALPVVVFLPQCEPLAGELEAARGAGTGGAGTRGSAEQSDEEQRALTKLDLLVYPLTRGEGAQLFPEGAPPQTMAR